MAPKSDKIDPATRIAPISEWGLECSRGFISNSRFGNDRVIERTNRSVTKKWFKSKAAQPPK